MIYGIGTDVVSVDRIRKVLLRFGERLRSVS
jgi:phosphopantetheinyl transferase (holo-ACP synthase)